MITADLRRAIARAASDAGFGDAGDPGLRPGGVPGRYASSVAFGLAKTLGEPATDVAGALAGRLAGEPWIAEAAVTGPGYLTVTVTAEAIAVLPARIVEAGPECARSDALRGRVSAAPPAASLAAAAGWEQARQALAAELTARLAEAAGATVTSFDFPEREVVSPPGTLFPPGGSPVAAAIAFAGPDAVRFALARAAPGRPVTVDPEVIARHVPGNPAYAVRYAHSRAASWPRWVSGRLGVSAEHRAPEGPGAAALGLGAAQPRPPADPGERALLDALSWLPERVAVAARRGRPDEFARYLEELAYSTIDIIGFSGNASDSGSGRLSLAAAARTGLAAGLGLLGIDAPDRL